MAVDSTLLAYLVPRVTHSTENTAIEALGYILSRSAACRGALRDVLRSGGSQIGAIARVETEVSDEKGGRPDLAGFDEHGRERLLIEVKFWAGLQPGQPNAYLKRLIKSDATGPSALLFVAPAARLETLWDEVRRRAEAAEVEVSEASDLKSAVIDGGECRLMLTSWAALLGAMAVRASAAGDSATALDIRQLLGLANRMDDEAFLPIQSEELGPKIPRRLLGLPRLVDDATARGREAGWITDDGGGSAGKHFYGHFFLLCGAHVWFGVNFKRWAQFGDTPLWLQLGKGPGRAGRKLTVDFDAARRALGLPSDVAYVEIHLPVGVEYDAVLDGVVAQLERIGQKINPGFQPPETP
ncbi:MAG: hypothetical protein OXU21_01825 [Chloroflexota bacterium]|nr:hypothetical protein [Chloroflexota bacterium]